LARELRSLSPGQVLGLLTDDPEAGADVVNWTRRNGHTLLCREQAPSHDVYYVRKRPS
jgi:TusA-related sulfurtransferase